MPGLSLVIASSIDKKAFSGAISDLQSDRTAQVELLYKDNRVAVVFSGHESYPKLFFENKKYVLLFEGMVYNREEKKTAEKLHEIAEAFASDRDVEENIRNFVIDSDGDYICTVYAKDFSSLLVFNDHFGRLPLYYHEGAGVFVLSREIKFLLHFIPRIIIDRFGLAQFLMFEHTLGDRTLFKNLYRFLPSKIAQTNIDTLNSTDRKKVCFSESMQLNFDGADIVPPKKHCVEQMSSYFMESVENRYSACVEYGYSCIADVSGGLDTRAVMMGIEKLGKGVKYFTHELATGDESRIAQMLGDLYGKKVRIVSASHESDFTEMEKFVYTTDCMVNCWTALMSWRDSSVKKTMVDGKTACFMGFNGEFVRHPFLPAYGHHSLQSMLRANILKTPLSSEWAGILAGIPHELFIESLEKYFGSYGEKTFEGCIKHFYFEYKNLVNAGEDRIRKLFWTVQPFWGKKLFEFENKKIPLRYTGYPLYNEFLKAIDPKALGIPVFGSAINLESDFRVKLFEIQKKLRFHARNYILSSRLTRELYPRLRGWECSSTAYKDIVSAIERVYERLEYLKEMVNEKDIKLFTNGGYGLTNLYRLLSVLMYFKQLEERFSEKISAVRQEEL